MILPVTHNLDPIIVGTTYGPCAMAILVDGVVKDLTGCTPKIVIHNGDTVIATLTAGNGLIIDAFNGIISFSLTFTQTSEYVKGCHNYYLNIIETDETTIYRYSEGNVEVRA